MQIETLMGVMSGVLSRIATHARFSLDSDPAVFNATIASWLTAPDFHLPNGGLVGLCCSSLLGLQFQEETAGADDLMADFRRFLLAASLAHGGWRGDKSISSHDLGAAGQISGCRLIKRLDRVLTPQFLARCGRESCQVLFLLVLGAVLGVGYAATQFEDHATSLPSAMLGPELQRSPTLWLAMKEHLCQMLAHHLVFVGSMLGIKLDTGLEQRIIDTAVSRWNKAESFVWADAVGSDRDWDSQHTTWRPAGPPSGVTKRELGGLAWRGQPPPPWPCLPSRPAPGPAKPVPGSCPDVAHLRPQNLDQWSENPQSYLSMFDEPDTCASNSPGSATAAKSVLPSRVHPHAEPRHSHQGKPSQPPGA